MFSLEKSGCFQYTVGKGMKMRDAGGEKAWEIEGKFSIPQGSLLFVLSAHRMECKRRRIVNRKTQKGRMHKRTVIVWALLAAGFCAVEFPGIFFVRNRVYPFVLGMPFLYGYVICCWFYMACVLFYAWRTRWGRQPLLKGSRDLDGKGSG